MRAKAIKQNIRYVFVIMTFFACVGVALQLVSNAGSDGIVRLTFPQGTTFPPAKVLFDDDTANIGYIYFGEDESPQEPPEEPEPEPEPKLQFSYNNRNVGSLSQELNLASNADWAFSELLRSEGTSKYQVDMQSQIAIPNDGVFFESGFVFSNVGHGGYIGMQTLTVGQSNQKGAIFSIWNATKGTSPGFINDFSGEGVGVQTTIRYSWLENQAYTVYVERDNQKSTTSTNVWNGYIGKKNGARSLIGSIEAPRSWGNLYPNNTFLERYGDPVNTCGEFEPAKAIFSNMKHSNVDDYVASLRVEIRNYSDCNGVFLASQRGETGYFVEIKPGN